MGGQGWKRRPNGDEGSNKRQTALIAQVNINEWTYVYSVVTILLVFRHWDWAWPSKKVGEVHHVSLNSGKSEKISTYSSSVSTFARNSCACSSKVIRLARKSFLTSTPSAHTKSSRSSKRACFFGTSRSTDASSALRWDERPGWDGEEGSASGSGGAITTGTGTTASEGCVLGASPEEEVMWLALARSRARRILMKMSATCGKDSERLVLALVIDAATSRSPLPACAPLLVIEPSRPSACLPFRAGVDTTLFCDCCCWAGAVLCLRGEFGVDRPKSGVLANRLGAVILLTTALGEMLIPNVFRRGEDGGVVAVCVAVIVAIGKQSEKTKEGSKLMWGVNEMNVSYRRLFDSIS